MTVLSDAGRWRGGGGMNGSQFRGTRTQQYCNCVKIANSYQTTIMITAK